MRPGSLGTIVHSITSPEGEQDWPTIGDDWAADESASGGFGPASGRIRPERIRKKPDVYRSGSVWRSWHEETGTCIHAGEIATPTPDGLLSTKGWAVLPERSVERLLYQTKDISLWSDAVSNATDQATSTQGGAITTEDAETGGTPADFPQGTLLWNVNFPDRDELTFGALVFAAPGADLSRVAWSQDNHRRRIRVVINTREYASGYEDPDAAEIIWVNCMDGGSRSDHAVDLTKLATDNAGGQGVSTDAKSTVWIGFTPADPDCDPTGGGVTWNMVLSDLRVNGIAPGDSFSASKLVKDIASRLGLGTVGVQNGGFNVLPYDLVNGAYGDALDYASLLQDWPWLVVDLGTGPTVRFGPWDDHVWTVLSTRQPFSPLPLEQYDRVLVPYTMQDGKTVATVRVRSASPLAVSRTYGPLALQDATRDSSVAEAIGAQALEFLRPLRYAGGMSLGMVQDEGGFKRSPYLVRAGETIYHAPSSIKGLRVANVHKTYAGVDVRFADSLTGLDRLVERRSKRLKLAAGVS